MAIPVWAVGQVLSASDVNNWLALTAAVIKPGDTSRANATQTADPDLTAAVAASASYFFVCYLAYRGAAVTTGDLKFSFTSPASSTMSWTAIFQDVNSNTDNTAIGIPNGTGISNFLAAGTSATNDHALLAFGTLVCGGSSGTLALNWAQNTTNAGTATIVRANSQLIVMRTN